MRKLRKQTRKNIENANAHVMKRNSKITKTGKQNISDMLAHLDAMNDIMIRMSAGDYNALGNNIVDTVDDETIAEFARYFYTNFATLRASMRKVVNIK